MRLDSKEKFTTNKIQVIKSNTLCHHLVCDDCVKSRRVMVGTFKTAMCNDIKTVTKSWQYNMRQLICENIDVLHLLPVLLLLSEEMHKLPIRARNTVLALSVILMDSLLNELKVEKQLTVQGKPLIF